MRMQDYQILYRKKSGKDVQKKSTLFLQRMTKNNTKIRDGKMDIKTFVTEKEGLEQWNPLMKGEFPIAASVLEKEVFPAFAVDMPSLSKDTYTLDEFLEMVRANSSLKAVSVEKQRFGYMVNDTICEVANVWINGAKLVTINSESTVLADILKTMKDVGIEGCENINYLQAVKRVIGMIDKPFAINIVFSRMDCLD